MEGWPLAVHGKIILHLGTLNESILTSTDVYLCIKPATISHARKQNVYVDLCSVWRSQKTQSVIYQTLNPYTHSLTSISLEMLTEDLPQLLQSLLVSVEQTISRVPFDELAFPKYIDDDDGIDMHKMNECADGNQKTEQFAISGNGSPKCAIRRREIITKNKPIPNRYTLRRMSIKTEMDSREKRHDIHALIHSSTPQTLTSVSTVTPATAATASNASASTNMNATQNSMPLFCLGGSFPHIDSDEDSSDDGTKSPNGGNIKTQYLTHVYSNLEIFRQNDIWPSLCSALPLHYQLTIPTNILIEEKTKIKLEQ